MIRNSVSDWQELSALYEEADALDGEARSAWLAALRTRDHPLLSQLERMLQASSDARESRFLDTSIAGIGLAPSRHAVAPGSRIGAYRLLRPIGEGGMAEVWLAERDDGAFQRQVAIKLLHHQAVGSERSAFAQRFERERDILASLAHPNIAALHDAGVTADNQPWLALEYVEGKTLTAWCDDEKLSTESRVRLFKQVLLAVQHAHAKLVIHRDLKPANILVTADGTVRLLDFGIAKLVQAEGDAPAETELTREGGRPLTLQYSSPEQLLGAPLTTASDVYSAGVVLYELLCGERPYELRHASTARLEDAILDVEPRAPSRRDISPSNASLRRSTPRELRRILADDLDAVVLKALEKVPEQRYASVEALSADLERWLQGKPVSSTAPSAAHRARKFVARHRLGVASATLGVLVLVGTSAVTVWMAVSAQQEKQRVVASQNFFLRVLSLADSEKSGVVDMSARELLEVGRQKAMTELASQPQLQAEVLSRIAEAQTSAGDYSTAEKALQEVSRIYARLGIADKALAAMVDLADAQFRMGSQEAAKASLAEAAAGMKNVPATSKVLYKAASLRGWIALDEGDVASARGALKEALDQASLAFGQHQTNYVDALRDLAMADLAAGDVRSATRQLESAQAIATGNSAIEPSQLIGLEADRANIEFVSGDLAASNLRMARTAAHCDRLLGAKDEACFVVRAHLAAALLRAGEDKRALELVPYLVPRLADDSSPKRRADAAVVVSRILARSRQLGAEDPARRRLEQIATGKSDQFLPPFYQVNSLLVLGEAALAEGRLAEARRLVDAGGEAIRSRGLAESLPLGWHSSLEALLLQAQGQDRMALSKLAQAGSYYARTFGPSHPLTALYGLYACRSLARLGRKDEAIALIDSALPKLRSGMGAESPLIERVLQLRARIESPARAFASPDTVADIFM